VQETDCRDVDEGEALIQPAAAGLSPWLWSKCTQRRTCNGGLCRGSKEGAGLGIELAR
jgi:hypothetical protein